MASVTDDELAKKRQTVEKLRKQIAAEESKRAERVHDQQNDLDAARLDAEAARLESQLAAIKEASKVSTVKEGASGPLEQAKDQLQGAQAQSYGTVTPVDTNDDNKG